MARIQEFDESEALTAAIRSFRRQGYKGVSIKTLEADTGLSSGSIYNSFGGKEAMFVRVLEHYNKTVVEKRIKDHLSASDPIAGLTSFFESLFEEPDGGAFGCLLTNSAIEFAGENTTASAEVARGFDQFLVAFKQTLLAIPQLPPKSAERKSLRLLTYYQGLLVLIRHGYDRSSLREAIKSEINSIVGAQNV